jgi:hypothetical protein
MAAAAPFRSAGTAAIMPVWQVREELCMADVVSLKDAAKRKAAREKRELQARARGKTLCSRGFHKWKIDQRKQFDVREGKLVTVLRCERCDATRTKLE